MISVKHDYNLSVCSKIFDSYQLNKLKFILSADAFLYYQCMCVCVCLCERERECVCVCVITNTETYTTLQYVSWSIWKLDIHGLAPKVNRNNSLDWLVILDYNYTKMSFEAKIISVKLHCGNEISKFYTQCRDLRRQTCFRVSCLNTWFYLVGT